MLGKASDRASRLKNPKTQWDKAIAMRCDGDSCMLHSTLDQSQPASPSTSPVFNRDSQPPCLAPV